MANRAYSGRFLLRAGKELHEHLVVEARQMGLSLNEHCVRKLSGKAVGERLAEVGLDREFLDRLVGASPERPLAVVLFGSVARGDFGTESDVDILVVFDHDVRIARSLYRRFDAVVDPAGFRHPPNPHLVALPRDATLCGALWLEVAMDGVVVWERGTRVSALLALVRELVASGAVTRRTAYGHSYWVRREEVEKG